MNFLRRIRRRFRSLFRRRQTEAEMAEEMRFHLEQRAADYADDGLTAEEARYAAQRKFGNLGSLQERARESRGWGWLERALTDVQLAVRQLAKSPGFSVLAIVTLGLGLGANTSMFSVLNSIALKPLPYPDSSQLWRIDRVTPENPEGRIPAADVVALLPHAPHVGQIAAYALKDTSVAEPGQPADIALAMRATATLFSVLGVQPELGRDFRAAEDEPGSDRVVILSQRYWRKRFGGRRDIIGRTMRVDGETHEIIGVLPQSFNDWRHLGNVDLFRPLALDAQKIADRQATLLRVIGRRAEQMPAGEVERFIANFGEKLAEEFPHANAGSTWRVVPLNTVIQDYGGHTMVPMIVGLSGFVLLIACSNLANLLLARTIARARELAVRAALGATRLQLLRPLIAEALLLALAGGVCALIFALWVADYFAWRSTGDNGERVTFGIDWRVLGWALAVSLGTAVAFGLAPALFALRLDLNKTLKSGGRGVSGAGGLHHLRRALIVGQFALAMVLLTGAGLFMCGLDELNRRRTGWDSERLITGTIVLPEADYPDAERIANFHRQAVERLEAVPGVASASIASFAPFSNGSEIRKYVTQGGLLAPHGREPAAVVNRVTPRHFETLGTHIIAGRAFGRGDTAASAPVMIISQAMATALFGAEDPIGRRLAETGTPTPQWAEIVGVTVEVKSVQPDPGSVAFQVYRPMAQTPVARNEIAVRTAHAVSPAVIDGIRAAITAIDPDLPVRRLQPADATVERTNYQLGVLRDILSSFAVLGLGLASLGIYGVIARMMAQRTSEFAIRLVLGASLRDISCLVLVSGVKLALLGSALGLGGALVVERILAQGFPAMQLSRPTALVGAALMLIAVALLACWLPARRAGRVDPVVALRAE